MLDNSLVFDGTISIGASPEITGVLVSGGAGTTGASTNVINLLAARDVGAGYPLGVHVDVLTALTGGTDLTVALQVSNAAAGTYYTIAQSPVVPAAQLIAGCPLFRIAFPPNEVLNAVAGVLKAPGQYIRLYYTITGTFSAGSVCSYLAPLQDRVQYTTYPNNYTAAVGTGL